MEGTSEMYKKVLIITSLMLVFAGFFGVMSSQRASADSDVRICHADDSTHDPYNSIEVDHSAVDGAGGGDHYKDHKGPIAFSQVEASRLKDLHTKWGDIIPPVLGHHAGLNWTTMGQAMWNNRCNFVTTVTPTVVAFVNPTCDEDGSYKIPTTTGIKYLVNNIETVAGIYPVTSDVTISVLAVAKTGYVIGDTAVYSWSHEYITPTIEECSETVVPDAVTFVAPTCDALGSYTIPAIAGVEYSVGDVIKSAGVYEVANGDSVTIKATALEGYIIEGTSEWSYTFTAPDPATCVLGLTTVIPIEVTFTAPTCSALGTYTIPSITGVVYSVDGVERTSGTYTVANGATVTVTAVATEGYSIEDTVTSSWTHEFVTPTIEECSETVASSAVTFVSPACDALGSYTIPTLTGVEYSVDDVVKAAGTYTVANGTSVIVKATALKGYILDGISEWSYTFTAPNAASCVLGITTVVPIKVTFTAPTCNALGAYTIPSITGVVYSVDGVVKTSGTYAVANGATVVVTAAATDGYSIEETTTSKWTYTFTAPSCGSVLGTSTTATTLPLTSGDTTAANVTIFSLITGVITIIGFAARSIFARQF